MDITISSSYASKTQCFFHNSAFWNIGMCNLQSVYDRRLPRNQTIFSMRPQRTTTGATSNTANITKHHETMDSTCCTDIYIYIYIIISRVVPSRFWNLISQLRGTQYEASDPKVIHVGLEDDEEFCLVKRILGKGLGSLTPDRRLSPVVEVLVIGGQMWVSRLSKDFPSFSS